MHIKAALDIIAKSEPTILDSHPKRGSIAIILKVPGHFNQPDLKTWLDTLPRDPQPELLFIKRAANPRDRWSGHIALPGGRHDNSETDRETAERETLEEVGVDLKKDGFYIGALDQRLLKVSWGRRVAMVLCPHVFVVNREVDLKPQWDEVASTFWHPLESMLRFDRQTYFSVPIGDRLDLSKFGVLAPLIKCQLGSLDFAAVELRPEHQVASEDLGSVFKCWGVTLGVLADLFEVLEPGYINKCWLPTISAWDMRFWVWVFNRGSLKAKRLGIAADLEGGVTGGKMDLMNKLLEGHFSKFPLAIGISVGMRYLAVLLLIVKFLQRRSRRS